MSLAKEAWDSTASLFLPPHDERADLKDSFKAAITGKKTKRQVEIEATRKELNRRRALGMWIPAWSGSPYSGSKQVKSASMGKSAADFYTSLLRFAKNPVHNQLQGMGWDLANSGVDIVSTTGGESIFAQYLEWAGKQ